MRVTELAKFAGVAPYVVRYYSQIGLLAPSRDPENGYRNYTTSDVNRVRFIRRAKLLGFKLSDIRLILGDADHGRSPCPRIRHDQPFIRPVFPMASTVAWHGGDDQQCSGQHDGQFVLYATYRF